jgi:hypothetical protein
LQVIEIARSFYSVPYFKQGSEEAELYADEEARRGYEERTRCQEEKGKSTAAEAEAAAAEAAVAPEAAVSKVAAVAVAVAAAVCAVAPPLAEEQAGGVPFAHRSGDDGDDDDGGGGNKSVSGGGVGGVAMMAGGSESGSGGVVSDVAMAGGVMADPDAFLDCCGLVRAVFWELYRSKEVGFRLERFNQSYQRRQLDHHGARIPSPSFSTTTTTDNIHLSK